MKTIIIFLIFIASTRANSNCLVVDGPANLRDTPKGKVILSIPANSTLQTYEDKEGWFQAYGYKLSDGRTNCDGAVLGNKLDQSQRIEGVIHKTNLLVKTFDEIYALDPFGAMNDRQQRYGDKLNQKHKKVVTQNKCLCVSILTPMHDAEESNWKSFEAGVELGKNCESNQNLAICSLFKGGDIEMTVCPIRNCLTVTEAEKLSETHKKSILEAKVKEVKESIQKKVSAKLIKALNAQHANWIPYIVPAYKKDNEYEFELETRPSFLKKKIVIAGKDEERNLLLFYRSFEDFKQAKLSIAIDGSDHLEVRTFPFSMSLTENDLGAPSACLAKYDLKWSVLACRQQDEISPKLGAFVLDNKDAIAFSENELKQFGERWCCDSGNHPDIFTNFE